MDEEKDWMELTPREVAEYKVAELLTSDFGNEYWALATDYARSLSDEELKDNTRMKYEFKRKYVD